MMRSLITGLGVVLAGPVAAESWTADMRVQGSHAGTYAIEGQVKSMSADTRGVYFVADAYGEGVDAGRDCSDVTTMEVDYFFGVEGAWEGHVLFSVNRVGDGFQVIDPTVFFSPIEGDDLVETYANFDTVTLALTEVSCGADGRFDMAVAFKGELLAGFGAGPDRVQLSGTADATLSMLDISEY